MFQSSIFQLPKADLRKVDFFASVLQSVQLYSSCALLSTKIKSVLYSARSAAGCWCLGCIILSFSSIIPRLLVTRRRSWAPQEGFDQFSSFLFWVNYHVIVVSWIIFSQRNNYYSDNKQQLMSFARMKVRYGYDDKTISYVKTFPRIWIMAAHPKYPNAF